MAEEKDEVVMVDIYCDCGNGEAIKVRKGTVAFYCPKCESTKIITQEHYTYDPSLAGLYN